MRLRFEFDLRRGVAFGIEWRRRPPRPRRGFAAPERVWEELDPNVQAKMLRDAEEVERFEEAWARGVAPEPPDCP